MPYKDLYSFDSKRVKCLGLIKDMVVSLNKLPSKVVVMDIIVADIPPQVWYSVVQILDFKAKGQPADGHDLCYHSYSE